MSQMVRVGRLLWTLTRCARPSGLAVDLGFVRQVGVFEYLLHVSSPSRGS